MAYVQITLRKIQESDLPNFVRWMNDPEVVQFLAGEVGQNTLDLEQQRYAKSIEPDFRDWYRSVEVDGKHIGRIGIKLDAAGKIGDLGMAIGEKDYWGKGYGTAMVAAALRAGFGELGLNRVHLEVFVNNPRAIRCYEKCGLRHEGLHRQVRLKAGKWIDVISMAILREDWQTLQVDRQDIHIREFRWVDYKQVIGVWNSVFSKHPQDVPEELSKKLQRDPDLFLLACDGPRVIGTVIGGWDGRRASFYRVAVHPDHQRCGIGTALMVELEARLRKKGALMIQSNSGKDNKTAHAFYESLGYDIRDDQVLVRKVL